MSLYADFILADRLTPYNGRRTGRMAESNAHGTDGSIRVSDLLAHTKELVWYLAE